MTVAPVSPSVGAALAAQATPVAPTNAVAGLAGSGAGQSAAVQAQTPPATSAPQQLTAATLIDALALKAVAQATSSEGGLALLMSDLSVARNLPTLPGPVQSAITQLLSLQAPLNVAPTADTIQAALPSASVPTAQSQASAAATSDGASNASLLPSTGPLKTALVGLQQSLRNWLSTMPVPPPQAATTPAAAPNPAITQPSVTAPSSDLTQVLSEAVQSLNLPAPAEAALIQAFAPVAAKMAAAATTTTMPTSQAQGAPVTEATLPGGVSSQTAASTVPTELQIAVPALEQALQTLLENNPQFASANETVILPSTAEPMATDSAMAALSDLAAPPSTPQQSAATTDAVASSAAAAPAVATAAATVSALAASLVAALPATATVDAKQVMQLFQQVFNTWFETPAAPMATQAPPSGSPQPQAAANAASPSLPSNPPSALNATPPPFRGGPTAAQAAVPSALPLNADPATIGTRLLRETNAALAHQELLQIASLPAALHSAAPSQAQNPQWMFEIPFATPQGTAIAQFKISRDGGRGKGSAKATPVWRANFSLDIEPMGPVHAQVVLTGDRTWVSLWAEREEGVARLRQNEAQLSTALKESNFDPEIALHAGAPRQPAIIPGHFLDDAS